MATADAKTGMFNKPIEIVSGVPKDAQGLRAALMDLLASKMEGGVQKYPGPVATGMDPLQTMASNIMSQQMYGQDYTGPNVSGAPWLGGGIEGMNPGTYGGGGDGGGGGGGGTPGTSFNPHFNRMSSPLYSWKGDRQMWGSGSDSYDAPYPGAGYLGGDESSLHGVMGGGDSDRARQKWLEDFLAKQGIYGYRS